MAGLLMVAGIALLGTVTAAVAAWFVRRVGDAARAEDDAADEALRAEFRALTEEVRRLRAELTGEGRAEVSERG